MTSKLQALLDEMLSFTSYDDHERADLMLIEIIRLLSPVATEEQQALISQIIDAYNDEERFYKYYS